MFSLSTVHIPMKTPNPASTVIVQSSALCAFLLTFFIPFPPGIPPHSLRESNCHFQTCPLRRQPLSLPGSCAVCVCFCMLHRYDLHPWMVRVPIYDLLTDTRRIICVHFFVYFFPAHSNPAPFFHPIPPLFMEFRRRAVLNQVFVQHHVLEHVAAYPYKPPG